jgi:hypothetical protein
MPVFWKAVPLTCVAVRLVYIHIPSKTRELVLIALCDWLLKASPFRAGCGSILQSLLGPAIRNRLRPNVVRLRLGTLRLQQDLENPDGGGSWCIGTEQRPWKRAVKVLEDQ